MRLSLKRSWGAEALLPRMNAGWKKKRGGPAERAGDAPSIMRLLLRLRLRNVVAEGSKEHGFVHVRSGDSRARCANRGSYAPPRVADDVGELRTPLNRSLRAFVEFVPEANGAFEDASSIRRAAADGSRNVGIGAAWRRFGVATRVAEQRRTITHGVGGRRADEIVRPDVSRASSIFAAAVKIDIKLRIVNFDRGEPLVGLDQSESAIRAERHVGKTRSAVTAGAVSTHGVETK